MRRLCLMMLILVALVSVSEARSRRGGSRGRSPVAKGSWWITGGTSLDNYGGDLYGAGGSVFSVKTTVNTFVRGNVFSGYQLDYTRLSGGGDSDWIVAIGGHAGYVLTSGGRRVTQYPYVLGGFKRWFMKGSSIEDRAIYIGAGGVFMLRDHLGIDFSTTYHFETMSYGIASASGSILNFGVGIVGLVY